MNRKNNQRKNNLRSNRRSNRKGGYIFTAKKHPERGIMSLILGIISIVSVVIAVYLAYKNNGNALPQYGAAVFLVTIYSIVGMILGVLSRMEKDVYYLCPYLGMGLNVVALSMISMILYAGAYGI